MKNKKNKKKPHLRIIGDVHGKLMQYIRCAKEAEYSIQLGDLSFDYDPILVLDNTRHKVIGGNHDNYEVSLGNFWKQTRHFLGNFGVHTVPKVGDIFFVRGAKSVDRAYRTEGYDWWPDEQITYAQGMEAIKLYSEIKPDIVISHDCPARIIDLLGGLKYWDGELLLPSMTANLLDSMFDIHKPKMWFFGHHHRQFVASYWEAGAKEGTVFRCLPELGYFDFEDE